MQDNALPLSGHQQLWPSENMPWGQAGEFGPRAGTRSTLGPWLRTPATAYQSTRFTGGERGIRTLDRVLPYTPLAGARLRPLGHLSVIRFTNITEISCSSACAKWSQARSAQIYDGYAVTTRPIPRITPTNSMQKTLSPSRRRGSMYRMHDEPEPHGFPPARERQKTDVPSGFASSR